MPIAQRLHCIKKQHKCKVQKVKPTTVALMLNMYSNKLSAHVIFLLPASSRRKGAGYTWCIHDISKAPRTAESQKKGNNG